MTPKAKKLYNKALKLWKEIAFLRDGRECQVKKKYPQIRINHTNVMQVDHCFSRADKNLFFNPRNATVVCSGCNNAKHYKLLGIDRAIDQIVMDRESPEEFGRMLDLHQTHGPNTNWGKIWWLEKVIEELTEYKKQWGET